MTRSVFLIALIVGSAGLAGPTSLDSPAPPGSGMYSMAAGADGKTYLSWIEATPGKASALRFSKLESGKWSEPRTVATGSDWFVNWADHPSITSRADGTLVAHWLVNNLSKSGAYGYGIRIAQSPDQGRTWKTVFKAGLDNLTDYSGFVSILPGPSGFSAVYLTPAPAAPGAHGEGGEGHGEHVKMVSIARFAADGTLAADTVVDRDACTCCNTTMVETSDGPIAAYRDHQGEVRDISVVRLRNGKWSAPTTVAPDNWKINACPTNGPVLDAKGRRVAIAWFTAAQDVGRVRLAFSDDAAASFSAPVTIDGGKPMGWPAIVMMDDGSAVVSWLESLTGGEGEVRLRRVWRDGRLGAPVVVAPAKAGRSAGIPQMVRQGSNLVVAWRSGDRVLTALVPVPDR